MKIFLAHHANTVPVEENPDRPLSELGRQQADRIGAHLKAAGISPAKVLHSDRLWTRQTAERAAAVLGDPALPAMPSYSIMGAAPLAPFLEDIAASGGDIVMTGHSEFLRRAGAHLLCGDEKRVIIEYKPGNAAMFCLEGEGDSWVVAYGLRQEFMGG